MIYELTEPQGTVSSYFTCCKVIVVRVGTFLVRCAKGLADESEPEPGLDKTTTVLRDRDAAYPPTHVVVYSLRTERLETLTIQSDIY